jgi:hypothetical protein
MLEAATTAAISSADRLRNRSAGTAIAANTASESRNGAETQQTPGMKSKRAFTGL